jgi:hypothetical protein
MADPGVQPSRVRSPRALRCVAVGLHLDPDRAATSATLVEGIEELLRRELDLGGAGGGDADIPTLIALPEHTGLLAMLVGQRGTAARARWHDGGTTLDILLALAGSYGEELGQLAARFPEVRSAGQLLHLVTCDTVVHTLVEELGQVAARLGVWLSVGAALPSWSWQPAPDGIGPSRVAVPTGPQVRNRQLLLAPTGELAAVHDKVTLVPLEADAEAGLGLEPASLAEVGVADLAIGRVGTVISKDAWMPDVNERLEQLGAQILLQPEAFDRWGAPDHDEASGQRDLWPPDKFQRGGWWMLQRHPGFRLNLAPMLLGSLGELAFDGQALVAVPTPAGEPGLGLLGQPADGGWAAVGPWWRDPAISGSVAGRVAGSRAEAARVRTAASERVAAPADRGSDHVAVAVAALPSGPGSGGRAVARLAGLGASTEVAAIDGPLADDGLQLVPAVAVDGERVWLAWIACDTAGRQQVRCTTSPDGGRRWEASRALSPGPEDVAATADGTAVPGGPRPQTMVPARRWAPRLAVVDGTPVCVHLGSPVGSWDVLSVRADRPEPAAPVRVDDADLDAGVLRERLHDSPVVLARDGELVAVWSDLRWPWVLPQVRLARSGDVGTTWTPSRRADGGALEGEPDPLAGRSRAETRGQATPAAAVVDGQLVLAWTERDADGVPTVRIARPDADEGPSLREFGGVGHTEATGPDHLDVSPEGPRSRTRAARPVLGVSDGVLWLVWERWEAAGGARLWASASTDRGRIWSRPQLLDPGVPPGAQQQRAALVPAPDGAVLVVFEDDRAGTAQVLAVTVGAAGVSEAVRLDDAPAGASARAPAAARVDAGAVVVWQDTRAGADRLRSVRVPV